MTSPHGKGVGEQVHPSVMLLATSMGIWDGGPLTVHSSIRFQIHHRRKSKGTGYMVYFPQGRGPFDLFAFLHTKPLKKGVYSKMKEFATTGSKFFPFRINSFLIEDN